MRPPPVWRIHAIDSLHNSAGASRFTWMVSRQAFQSLSATMPIGPVMAALFTKISTRGHKRRASARIAWGASGSRRSAAKV